MTTMTRTAIAYLRRHQNAFAFGLAAGAAVALAGMPAFAQIAMPAAGNITIMAFINNITNMLLGAGVGVIFITCLAIAGIWMAIEHHGRGIPFVLGGGLLFYGAIWIANQATAGAAGAAGG
jgi:hypothetical protein